MQSSTKETEVGLAGSEVYAQPDTNLTVYVLLKLGRAVLLRKEGRWGRSLPQISCSAGEVSALGALLRSYGTVTCVEQVTNSSYLAVAEASRYPSDGDWEEVRDGLLLSGHLNAHDDEHPMFRPALDMLGWHVPSSCSRKRLVA